MTATDRLNAMQQRCDAATEGPWTPRDCGDDCCVWVETHVSRGQDDHTIPFGREDGAFIAAARTDLPATIAALRAVLDLHLPVLDVLPWLPRHPAYCGECSDDEVVTYPCPTVRAITEALT